jgi:hypothetical protein
MAAGNVVVLPIFSLPKKVVDPPPHSLWTKKVVESLSAFSHTENTGVEKRWFCYTRFCGGKKHWTGHVRILWWKNSRVGGVRYYSRRKRRWKGSLRGNWWVERASGERG